MPYRPTFTHVRKCTRPSPLYRTASDEKLGVGLGMRLGVRRLYVLSGTIIQEIGQGNGREKLE